MIQQEAGHLAGSVSHGLYAGHAFDGNLSTRESAPTSDDGFVICSSGCGYLRRRTLPLTHSQVANGLTTLGKRGRGRRQIPIQTHAHEVHMRALAIVITTLALTACAAALDSAPSNPFGDAACGWYSSSAVQAMCNGGPN